MEAPIGKYVSQIIKEEGTAANLMAAMYQAKESRKPYFAYPLSQDRSVIFRTPDVPVSREVQDRLRLRLKQEQNELKKARIRLNFKSKNKLIKAIGFITFGLLGG